MPDLDTSAASLRQGASEIAAAIAMAEKQRQQDGEAFLRIDTAVMQRVEAMFLALAAEKESPGHEPYAWWAETGTAGTGEGCSRPFWLRDDAVAYWRKHGGYVAPLFRRWGEQPAAAATIPAEILDLATQAVAEALGDSAFDCTRVWEAWSYGTMGPNDFTEVHERADEIAAAALKVAYPAIVAAERSRIRQAVFARAMLWRDQIIAATTSAEVLAASHMYQAAHHILDREIDPVQ